MISIGSQEALSAFSTFAVMFVFVAMHTYPLMGIELFFQFMVMGICIRTSRQTWQVWGCRLIPVHCQTTDKVLINLVLTHLAVLAWA
jgi:hypothetical protein